MNDFVTKTLVEAEVTASTSTLRVLRSGAVWLASATPQAIDEFLGGLSDETLLALPWLFEFWALPHQLPPEGAWRSWVIMGGRGAGKTRAGAEWVRAQVEGARPRDAGAAQRVALVAETIDQAREVMVFGDSGILACTPPDRRPQWHATRKRLIWPNGAEAILFSAHDPESLRGPQFDAAWVDEIGCAAINKGTNQPNRFLDPKSSESGLPRASTGIRDDLIQQQYLRAMAGFWTDPANNPVSELYGAPMVDFDRAHVWAWDARPFPAFPNDRDVWSDGENHACGHWITGRATAQALGPVVRELCAGAGVTAVDTSRLHGLLRGYTVDQVDSVRAILQPMMLTYGFEAVEREGALRFRLRDGVAAIALDEGRLALSDGMESAIEAQRAAEAEAAGRVRLTHVAAGADYEAKTAEAVFPGTAQIPVSGSEVALVLTGAEGRQVVERWLAESRVARDTLKFSLPPSRMRLGAGDVVRLRGLDWRIDRVEGGEGQLIEAVRVEPAVYNPSDAVEERIVPRPFTPPVPVYPLLLDLPLLRGDEVPWAPHLAVTATPWPGTVACYSATQDAGYALNKLLPAPSVIGETLSALDAASAGLWDRGAALRVKVYGGGLSSAAPLDVLNGANVALIGDGSSDNWEVFQFQKAVLVAPDTYDLSLRLRGQAGSDAIMPEVWPVGSRFVLFDGAAAQIDLALSARGLARHYLIGAAARPYDDPSYVHEVAAFQGIGLRPYAPCHLSAGADGSGGVTLRWIRRTRIDGDSWQGVEVPLGEDRQAYLVRVIADGQILREESVGTPEWTYAPAAQSADGIAGTYTLAVAQVSDSFGPGPFAEIALGG